MQANMHEARKADEQQYRLRSSDEDFQRHVLERQCKVVALRRSLTSFRDLRGGKVSGRVVLLCYLEIFVLVLNDKIPHKFAELSPIERFRCVVTRDTM